MNNKVLKSWKLNLEALREVKPAIYYSLISFTSGVAGYFIGSFLVGKLSRSRCFIFGAFYLSFFVIVMVVARSARRNLEQKSGFKEDSADHDE